MSIDIEYELTKLNFEYNISKELNEKRICAILRYCNAVEYLEEQEGKYEHIKKEIFDKFVILKERNTSSRKDFSEFKIDGNKFILFLNGMNEYECTISLYEEGDKNGKLSVRYEFTFTPCDIGYNVNEFVGYCLRKFISDFNISVSIFNKDNFQVKRSNFGYHMYEPMSISDFRELFKI